jgi:hypothetical protein
MDPNLTCPIVLNASINATLIQPPSVWWSSATTISGIITASAAVFGIYLGERMSRSAENKHNFITFRKNAYSKYISLFTGFYSEVSQNKKEDIIVTMWMATLEVRECGDLRLENKVWILSNKLVSLPGIENKRLRIEEMVLKGELMPTLMPTYTFLRFCDRLKELGLAHQYGSTNQYDIYIGSLDDFIELLEGLQRVPRSVVNQEKLFETGRAFIPLFRDELLNRPLTPRKFLKRHYRAIICKLSLKPGSEEIKKKGWWRFWK